MRAHIALALAAGLLVAAGGPNRGGGKKAAGLDGTWVVVSVIEDGKELDEDHGKGDQVVFEGKTVTIKTDRGKTTVTGTFRVDPIKRTIDLPRGRGPHKTEIVKGIYALK